MAHVEGHITFSDVVHSFGGSCYATLAWGGFFDSFKSGVRFYTASVFDEHVVSSKL